MWAPLSTLEVRSGESGTFHQPKLECEWSEPPIHSSLNSPLLWKRWILLPCIVLEWTGLWSYLGFSRLLNQVQALDLLLILKMSFCCTRSGSCGRPIECLDSSRSASMVLQTIRWSTKTQIHISAKCTKSYWSIIPIKNQSKTWIETCFCHCTWFE